MKFGKNKDSKKKSQRELWVYGGAAVACLFLGLALVLSQGKPQSWPYLTIDEAEKVSLSELSAVLKDDGTGLRAAVVENKIYVEMRIGAGDETDLAEAVEIVEPAILYSELPYPSAQFIQDTVLASGYEVELFRKAEGVSILMATSVGFQILFLMLIVFVVLQMTGRGPGGSSFGTERGFTVVNRKDLDTGLHQVAGLETLRADVEEVISLLKDEGSAARAGGRLPRGLLLDGPPGTGKTLIARAMAKEAGVNFIRVDASSMSQMYVGLGAMKIRKIFRLARKQAPCIIFIDEIDAVGGARGGGGSGSESEKDNTLNALLTELDGFEDRSGLFVIAATNRPEYLDQALVRPGRIDRRITLGLPDIKAREKILEVHCAGKPLDKGVDLHSIAATAFGMSGAQLENLVNEAALHAGRRDSDIITMSDMREARDRVLMPRSGGTIKLLEDERRLTAAHEAGHAVAAILSPHADPVERVTIAPRGGALGFVMQTPDRDRLFETKAGLKSRLVVSVAGREAERMFFGDEMVTTGAASDIRQATAVAKAMVTEYGMSSFGFVVVDPRDPTLFDTQNPPSQAIRQIVDEAVTSCAKLLEDNRDALDRLTQALLEKETLSGDEARDIVLGKAQKKTTTLDVSDLVSDSDLIQFG